MNRFLALGVLAAALSASPVTAAPPQPPRLIVTIVIDQFSANLFNQNRASFTGGLKTLSAEGLVYANGYQAHANTETCPGHSTILTGMHPSHTGITENSHYDSATGKSVYCLAAPANRLAHGLDDGNGPVGPDALRVSTLGDWLKATSPASRVFAVSGKDRGAITLGGASADGTYWFTGDFGFTTYVRPGEDPAARLTPVAALNSRIRARLKARPAAWNYTSDACRKRAANWPMGGDTFRSALPPGDFAFDLSPLLDEVTLEAAEVLLREQKLGRGAAIDMLGVSLSATDRVGHRYGTQGPEMCEQLRRLDVALGRFIEQLRGVPGGVLVVLTADHGGSDFPERLSARGEDAHRSDPAMSNRLNAILKARFALSYDPLRIDGGSINIVGADKLALRDPLRREVATLAVALLHSEPQIAGVFTREELLATVVDPMANPEGLSLRERMALSTDKERSPDLSIAYRPGTTIGKGSVGGTISGHGSPWDYDRRVPIIFWWPGADSQERSLPIRTVDIAPTLANAMAIVAPPHRDGRCLNLDATRAAACGIEPATAPATSGQDR